MRHKRALLVAWVCLSTLSSLSAAQPDARTWIESINEPDQGLVIRDRAARTRFATFASTTGRGVILPITVAATAESRALSFVDTYGDAFGLTGSSDVRIIKSHSDDLGVEHVRLQQLHKGVPVTGGELVVHLRGARAVAANGHTIADFPEDVTARIPPELAKAKAHRLMTKYFPAVAPTVSYSEPLLEILNRTLLSGKGTDRSHLAWFVEASGIGQRRFIWIDARSGAILLHFNQMPAALYRTVYTANDTETLPGTLLRVEGEPPTGDTDSDNAYLYAGVTYNYYVTSHGRDSYDGQGSEIRSTTHFCFELLCPDLFQNAFWDGNNGQMVYGNGFASADDVVGHELTHGVIEYTAALFYYQQSGALNESFADIFGETIDLGSSAGGGDDTEAVRWLIGEDSPIGAFRNMIDPNFFGNPEKMTDDLFFVCGTNAWTDPFEDSGGVHANSGVPSHAYALMVDGGSFNGKTVVGIGLTKAAKIEFRALTVYLTSGSSFIDDYHALNQSCTDLIGTSGITAPDCAEVKNALDAVEMHLPWGCPGTEPAPDRCPTGKPVFMFLDGFETGVPPAMTYWTAANTATGSWVGDTDVARNGFGMATGNNSEGLSIHTLMMTNPVVVPAAGRMYFDHLYEFENDLFAAYDGGRFEYSTDGGTNWTDANGLVDAGHAYDGMLESSNPFGAVMAYVGASFGYTATRLNLASLAGQNIQFRFRIGQDDLVASLGWLIDDVGIYTCSTSLPPFTDDPIVAGTTVVKTVHVGELRMRIDTLRLLRGLSLSAWTSPILTPASSIVNAADITKLRNALADVYTVSGLTLPVYTDPVLAPGVAIKAAHISELRAALLAIE